MIKEYDKVKIKSSGITGEVVDIYNVDGTTHYTVEAKDRGTAGGYGENSSFKLYDCEETELVTIDEH